MKTAHVDPYRGFWYVVASTAELSKKQLISREILGEWLVCYRDSTGRAVIIPDRCLHRNARLSRGWTRNGQLICPYHGWHYGSAGQVSAVPSLAGVPKGNYLCLRAPAYDTCEQNNYIYVRLAPAQLDISPFPIPYLGESGWGHLRLVNRFHNTVDNCVENYIDIPHTAFVHAGLFRESQGEVIAAHVVRRGSSVQVRYRNERRNLGRFAWLLNPQGREIVHTDSFHAPSTTCVQYRLDRGWHFIITSQAVPEQEDRTLVYTDITYTFGRLTRLAHPWVRRQAQRVIDQDIKILAEQMEVIRKYGRAFIDTPADKIHQLVDSIREAIARGEDPQALPEIEVDIEFAV